MLPSFDHIYPEINRGMCGRQRRSQGHQLGLYPGIDDGNRIAVFIRAMGSLGFALFF